MNENKQIFKCDQDMDCLPNRIFAKVIGHLLHDNEGISIHLDDTKFVVGIDKGMVKIVTVEEEEWEDYQMLYFVEEENLN